MTEKNANRLRLIWGFLSGFMLVFSGIALIAACLQIYFSADQAFSREAVAQAFAPISLPIYLTLGCLLVGLLLDCFLPGKIVKSKPVRQDELILRRLQAGTDPSVLTPESADQILLLQKRRSSHKLIRLCLVLAGCAVFGIYLLVADRFPTTGINDAILRSVLVLLGCFVPAFVWSVIAAYQYSAGLRAEIELLKKAGIKPGKLADCTTADSKGIRILRVAVLVVAIGILAYGFFAGGMADVLTKAVNICTECVGLG